MPLNPDGTYTIKNATTGETKIVTKDQLPQYGLSPTGPTGPDYNAAINAKVTAPVAALTGQNLSNTTEATRLPAITAQSNAATTGVPVTATATNQLPPPVAQQDVQKIKSSYQDTWRKAKDITTRTAIANDYKTATGNDLFQLYLPQSSIDSMKPNLSMLTQLSYIKKGIQNDPQLIKVMGNPVSNGVITQLMKLPAGQSLVQQYAGLNDDGMQALSAFTNMQGASDRQLIGGRVTGYLNQIFSPSFLTTGRKVGDTQNQIKNMENAINNTLNVDAKNGGFQKWSDVPGLDAYQQQLSQPQNDIMGNKINNYEDLYKKYGL